VQRRINFENKNLMQKGFTLVELLVVIVILGILAAVVVFAVTGITSKGQSSACTIEVRTVNTALQAFNAKSTTNAYPTGTVVAGATGMFGQLKTAGLIQQSAPGATANYTPTYDGAGNYAATCP
jgi:prepilin-type N-terminal cleavage/methylation domain-containing protein